MTVKLSFFQGTLGDLRLDRPPSLR